MSDTQTFQIVLEDNASGSVSNLTGSLKTLKDQIKADEDALANLTKAQNRFEAAGRSDIGINKKMTDLKGNIGKNQDSFLDLGGKVEDLFNKDPKVDVDTKGSKKGLDDLFGALEKTEGPLKGLGKGGKDISEIFGKLGGKGGAIVLVVVAVLALATAAILATVALVKMAIAGAGAERKFKLLAKGATETASEADALVASVNKVSHASSLAKTDIQDMALGLSKAGLSGKALEDTLSSMAIATSVRGAEAASAIESLAKSAQKNGKIILNSTTLEGTGLADSDIAGALAKNLNISFAKAKAAIESGTVSVEDGLDALNGAVKAKFGQIADDQLLDFDTQLAKSKENIDGLFKNVNIEPFLKGMKSLLSLFDENTSSGKALQHLLKIFLDPLMEAIGAYGPEIKEFFLGIEIALVRLKIAFTPVIRKIKELSGAFDTGEWITSSNLGAALIYTIAAAVIGLAIGFGLLALAATIALAGVAIALLTILLPFILIGAAIYGLILLFQMAYDFIAGLDFGQIATDLIDGLVNGITSGAGMVYDAIANLANGMIDGIKGVLGIASPSKIFKELGNFTAEGMEVGIDEGSVGVNDAVNGMVEVPNASNSSSKAGSGNKTYIILKSAVTDTVGLAEQVKMMVTNIMEGDAITLGLDVEMEVANA